MRPKNKKHKHFSRTDNKKYQEQNHKKEKTNNNNTNTIYCCYFYRIRVHYTVLTQHTTPTNNTQPHATHVQRPQPARSCSYKRGDSIEQQPCVAPDTQQHAKQQNKPKHKHTLLKPSNQQAERPQKILASSTPTTPHAHTTHAHTRGVSHLKKLATTRY